MSAIVNFILSLSGLLAGLIAGAIWLWRRPASTAARRYVVGVVALYAIASVYAVPYAVGRLLVAGFHEFGPADVPSEPAAIVLLGAGNTTIHGWQGGHFSILEPTGGSRVLEAVRIYRLMGNPLVISSGGLVAPRPTDEPSGITMREALVRFGIPGSRIIVEQRSGNTHDEAVIVAAILRTLRVERVVLVTTDTHMRRSIAAFRAQKIEAIPAIAPDPELPIPMFEWIVPTGRGLERTLAVAHELLGLVYYAARGWL
jgi:uncharacterized SAM-binding protein YcdF (DUF218 family)